MAEEDLLFGKHMHLFGGIEPDIMKSFVAERVVEGDKIYIGLSMEMPTDTIVNNHTLCSIGGVVICRKEGSYPEDEFDGYIDRIPYRLGSFRYDDRNVEVGKTYYYAAFPYSTQGVYSRNTKNRSELTLIEREPICFLRINPTIYTKVASAKASNNDMYRFLVFDKFNLSIDYPHMDSNDPIISLSVFDAFKIIWRPDRYAKNPDDVYSYTADDPAGGLAESSGYRGSVLILNSDNSINWTEDSICLNASLIDGWSAVFPEGIFTTYNDMYFSVFAANNTTNQITDFVEGRCTWHYKKSDYVLPQPTNGSVELNNANTINMWCNPNDLSFNSSGNFISGNDDYMLILRYMPMILTDAAVPQTNPIPSNETYGPTAQTFQNTTLTGLATDGTWTVYSNGYLRVNITKLTGLDATNSNLDKYFNFAIFGGSTNDSRFTPTGIVGINVFSVTPRQLQVQGTAVSSLEETTTTMQELKESQQTITDNQLVMMEAMADIYEANSTI